MYKTKKDNLDQWSSDRKRRFLLKNEIKVALSVDTAVWDDFEKNTVNFKHTILVVIPISD
ncbi:hypothetical protein [Marinicella gelatinilytica]|uniref:hypothetical protein n=1 Tax=Marinicella gelatinilytica TaxID=2996017 RepID=UPI002260FF58|nr:hypothetical protein [Marinicella gelatinilytica]MCX7544218.1 hypothetical protein [Marinicella gelatinilytica]